MKVCNICKKEKPLTEFNKKRNSGTLSSVHPYCKPCQGEYQRSNYEGRREDLLEGVYGTRNARKNEIRMLLADFYAANPCVDCGETDLLVLEFDHVTGKEFDLNTAIRNVIPIEKIKDEFKKGEVRCANCHRRITAEHQNSWRWKYKNGIPIGEEYGSN